MNINYTIEGNGKTLVFIHGLSDSLEYWQPLAGKLKECYRILRYDLRGHGFSESGDEKICMDDYVNDLLCLLDELEIAEADLVGFSLGGAIALDFALEYPERVSSIVLVSSFCKCDEHLSEVFGCLKAALERGFPNFFDAILPMVLCPDVIREYEEELEMLKSVASETADLDAYIDAVDVCLNFDVEDRLWELDVPVLIVTGRYDDLTPVSMQDRLHTKIKGSEMIVMDDVKHNVLVGQSIIGLSEALVDFYSDSLDKEID